MNTIEAVAYVKGLNIDDKEKAAVLMALINGNSSTKNTVITKSAPDTVQKSEKKPVKSEKKAEQKSEKKPVKSEKKAEPVQTGEIYVIQYSEKSGAIIGDTKPIKDVMIDMKLTFNRFLTVPEGTKAKEFKSGDKVAGWLFSMKRIDEVQEQLETNKVDFINLIKPAKKSK